LTHLSFTRAVAFLLLLLAYSSNSFTQDPSPTKPEAQNPGFPDAPVVQGLAISKTPATLFAQGMELFREEKFASAAEQFELAAAPDPKNSAISYAWLARTYIHLHKLADAEAAVEKAILFDKELPEAQTAQAELDFRLAKLSDAEHIYRSLIQEKKAGARAYYGLSEIYTITANYKTAKSLLVAAHTMAPKDPDISRAWLRTLSRKERLEEFKRRFAESRYENEEEQTNLADEIAILEDREKNPARSCRLTTKVVSTEAKLEPLLDDPKRVRGFGLPVSVNGVKSTLLLDTGANGILINSRIAEKAGLVPLGEQRIGGIGDKGAAHGYSVFAKQLQIGNLEFENCYINVVDKKNGLGEDGLVGADVFEDFLIDIDFLNRRLRLSQLPPFPDEPTQGPALQSDPSGEARLHNRFVPPEFEKYERAYRFGHMLLLPTKINDAPFKLFLIDTGAWDNMVTPVAAREATKLYSGANVTVKGLSGKVEKIYTTGIVSLKFSHFQRNQELVAFDLSHLSDHIGTEVSGTLGFAMLYQLEIRLDYRDNLVEFQYDPNRNH
jgi:tetratricopeptide (TPR) repeat protein